MIVSFYNQNISACVKCHSIWIIKRVTVVATAKLVHVTSIWIKYLDTISIIGNINIPRYWMNCDTVWINEISITITE